jgi:hypothetical protein
MMLLLSIHDRFLTTWVTSILSKATLATASATLHITNPLRENVMVRTILFAHTLASCFDYSLFYISCCVTAYSFITGFIFYNFPAYTNDGEFNTAGNVRGLDSYLDLSLKYKDNLVGLNRDAFDMSKESAIRGYNADPASRESIYNFCTGR